MNKIKFNILSITIYFLFFICQTRTFGIEQNLNVNSSSKNIAEPNVIDSNLAAFAAADYLPAFYPGNWEYFKYIICYDIEGKPAAYLIIFHDPNSCLNTWQQVTDQIKKSSNELDEMDRQIRIIQASQETPQEDKNKLIKEHKAQRTSTLRKSYLSGDFATVVTGATNQSQLFIRCYRGLPEIIVKKPDVQKELDKKYSEYELGQVIYLSSSDICYEFKIKKITEQGLQLESYIIYPKEKTIINIQKIKDNIQNIVDEKEKQLLNLPSESRKIVEEGESNRKLDNIQKWAEYKTEYENEKLQQKKNGEK